MDKLSNLPRIKCIPLVEIILGGLGMSRRFACLGFTSCGLVIKFIKG